MKIINKFFITSLIVFFISSTSLAQTDTTASDSPEFLYTPRFAGVQVEGCILFFGSEFGGVVDVDFFSNNKDKFIGLRFAFEKYEYGGFYGYERGLS